MRSFRFLRSAPAALSLGLGLGLGLGVVACGHPASDKECQEIVERIATLEIEKSAGTSDAKTVSEQVDETKKALATNTLKDCVGKRITEHAMVCVHGAKTSQQIVDDCFK
ncbi:MAG: hypothetical protein ABI548_12935 [Polyangiaceae bacterium]